MSRRLGRGRLGVRHAWKVIALVGLVVALIPSAGSAAPPNWMALSHTDVWAGVAHEKMVAGGPLRTVDVARISASAPVHFRVVLSNDRVLQVDPTQVLDTGAHLETTSSMCRRVGGVVCINGDFSLCRQCGEPRGGMVINGSLVRSPHPWQRQLSLTANGLSTEDFSWSAALVATYMTTAPPPPGVPEPAPVVRTERRELAFDAVNHFRKANQLVLFTRSFSRTTLTRGGTELLLRVGGNLQLGNEVPVAKVGMNERGGNVIPAGGVVVSGTGHGNQRLREFWHEFNHRRADVRQLTLVVRSNPTVLQSLGAHPVILRGGKIVPQPPADRMTHERHPRTLVGWKPGGNTWLVTIDGRQAHSHGSSLLEAAQLLRSLGATEGINLDGGGSSTFVASAPCRGVAIPCILNRPSDGRERRVTSALAVIPNRIPVARAAGLTAHAAAAPASLSVKESPAAAALLATRSTAKPDPAATSKARPPAPSSSPAAEVRRSTPPPVPPPEPALEPEQALGPPGPVPPPSEGVGAGIAVIAGLAASGVGAGAVAMARGRRPRRR